MKSALLRCIGLEREAIEELNRQHNALLERSRKTLACVLKCEDRILEFEKRLDALSK